MKRDFKMCKQCEWFDNNANDVCVKSWYNITDQIYIEGKTLKDAQLEYNKTHNDIPNNCPYLLEQTLSNKNAEP